MESKSFLNVGSICHEENNFIFDYELFPFWDSFMYDKAYFKNKKRDKNFKFYDECTVFKYLFFNWVYKWATYISKGYNESYKLHPLPVSDQILYWQPIFSKHVSDGLVKLESYQTRRYHSSRVEKKYHPYRSILIRAIFLTFWRRTFFGLIGIILTNILSTSIAILVKKLLVILNDQSINLVKTLLLLFSIIAFNLIDGLVIDNLIFYLYRLIHMIQYSFSITVFQLGLCHRYNYFNNIDGFNSLNVCNQVVHSCDPDSECSKNPFFCPALRFKSKDIGPKIFAIEFIDSYYISLFFESVLYIVNFLSRFIYGIILLSYQIKINIWILYIAGALCVFLMVIIEVLNTYVLNLIYLVKDFRISKCIEIISGLPIINKMLCDDIALNIVTECRNNELLLFLTRIFLTLLNKSLYIIFTNVSFYILKRYFVGSVTKASFITDIDTAGFMATFYIFFKIMDSMNMLPHSIKRITTSYTSYNRIKSFTSRCSPNFYISDNKYTGSTKVSTEIQKKTNDLPLETIVYYNNATFSWVNNRKDLINENYDPYLLNVNFELKRGQIAIVTGSQGSGKSNFIKSILGEMTLVGGSMAVVPLHTSMPIFYASQDIWLQHGTIRSNITFGYRFDEQIYNTVLKAVELQSDISTWEKGDLRVVSDNAHTLSGGQRVRMEMARAIYACLLFRHVNKEYNNGKCSLLICLDSPFHGLDPFVSKTVFNNLFNINTGILISDDLSVVLSSTKRSLDICLKSCNVKQFPDIPIYNIVNYNMVLYRTLHSEDDTHRSNSGRVQMVPEYSQYSDVSDAETDTSFKSPRELIDKAYDKECSKTLTNMITANKYGKSDFVSSSNRSGFRPYIIYFSAAGMFFVLFLVFTFSGTIMDNIKFIFASELADYIKERTHNVTTPAEMMNRFSDIKTYSDKSLKSISIFTICVVSVCFLSNVFLTISCVKSSRKIHEYCIDSIFKNSPSVIKIKREISKLITYLSSDIFQIDESLGYAMSTALVSLVESLIHVLTLCYLIPLSTPIIIAVIFIIIRFVFVSYVNASKNLQIASMESTSQINDLCEKAISGSVTYRCFKKEQEFLRNIIEHTDYYMRCLFLNKSVLSRSSIASKFLFSIINLVLLIPLVRREYYNVPLHSGVYGLAISLAMIFSLTFTNFMIWFGRLEVLMCAMKRFESFVPPGTKCRFLKKKNVREEDLIVKFSENVCTDEQANISKNTLYKRREREYAKSSSCFRQLRCGNKPVIHNLDVSKHLPPTHFIVQIKNLFVSTSESKAKEQKHILKNITVSASGSDIIGIIGRTGSGKTTLLSVLQNTIENRTGQVILDGKDLNEIPKNVLTQVIGVLPQLPFVFKGWTVRRFLDPRKLFTDDEINQALEDCGLLELVNGLHGSKRLDTVIIPEEFKFVSKRKTVQIVKPNNRESKYRTSLTVADLKNYYADSDMILSSSQLRTLSFARLVLYRHFYRIILVDEPPSDNCVEGEEENINQEVGIPIYELIQKFFGHCTTFVTAHDANALVLCTSVWVLHNGQLIRTCKREEIMANESIASIIEESVRRKSLNK